MFARDFVDLDQPFTEVAPRFVPDTDWLVPLAVRAVHSALALAARLAGHEPATLGSVDATVRCTAGPVRAAGAGILVPIVIAGADVVALPHLVGELEVAPVGRAHSQVACNVTFRRPDRAAADRGRVDRSVAAGVRELLRGIAEHLAVPAAVARP